MAKDYKLIYLDSCAVSEHNRIPVSICKLVYTDFGEISSPRNAPDGLTRSEINDLFGGHESKARLDVAVRTLESGDWIREVVVPTDGRNRKVYKSV